MLVLGVDRKPVCESHVSITVYKPYTGKLGGPRGVLGKTYMGALAVWRNGCLQTPQMMEQAAVF